MLSVPAPDPREGERLAAAIGVATGRPADVTLVGDEWRIVTDADEDAVRAVVEAHEGTPEPVAPSVEDRFEAFLKRVESIPETATAAQTRDAVRAAAADTRANR